MPATIANNTLKQIVKFILPKLIVNYGMRVEPNNYLGLTNTTKFMFLISMLLLGKVKDTLKFYN